MEIFKRLFNRGEPTAQPTQPIANGGVPPATMGEPPGTAMANPDQPPSPLMTGASMNTTEPDDQPSSSPSAPTPADQPFDTAEPSAPTEESTSSSDPADPGEVESDPPFTDPLPVPETPLEEAPSEAPAPDDTTAATVIELPETMPLLEDTEASPAPESAPTTPLFPAAGALVGGRYVVLGPLGVEEASTLLGGTVPVVDADLYAVEDTRAYERCWSCGSTGNGASQRFCMDCGAPLQHRHLVLARTAAAKGESEEFSEDGAFFHLVRPRKQFGSAGMTLEVGACSAEGPHHPNEDSYWTASVGGCFDSRSDMFGVVVLADGMGGYAPGSGLISKMIVSSVGRSVFHLLHTESETEKEEVEIRAVIHSAVAEANSRVLDEIQVHGEMGATLVVGVVYGQCAYIANIGDSRAYYIAPSGAVTQITRDQSLIEQQVVAGLLSADAAYTAFGNNVILHAIGEERVEEAFDWYSQPLEPGGRLMLCSDGYWKTMRRDVWDAEIAASRATLRDLSRSMVESALARGSDDNTTVVLVGID